MPFSHSHPNQYRPLWLILAVLILSRVLFIILMPATYSKDLHAWLAVMELLKNGENPYYSGVLNWPPVWMQVLFVIQKVSDWTTFSKIHLIQSFLIFGECLAVSLAYHIAIKIELKSRFQNAFFLAWAINPICIFLSCQHCNFDIFVGFWILGFIYLMMQYFKDKEAHYWLAACFCLGLGILTKTIPFVLSPVLMIGLQQRKKGLNIFGLLLLLMPVTIAMSVIFTLSPEAVSDNVLSYRSMAGWYGITGLMNVMNQHQLLEWYRNISPYLIMVMMFWTSYCVYRKDALSARQLIVLVLTVLIFLTTFGPGYTPPYILWYLAPTIIYYFIAPAFTKVWLIVGLVILVLTYTFEYAFFPSHGYFISYFDKSKSLIDFCEMVSQSANQTLIRLPMFAFYILFFIRLIIDKNNVLRYPNVEKPIQFSS